MSFAEDFCGSPVPVTGGPGLLGSNLEIDWR